MRPGPGLVVMALAFISGARRGSTSSISSKTTTTTSSPPPLPPQVLATTRALTSSVTLLQTTVQKSPPSSSSFSYITATTSTSPTGTGDTVTTTSSSPTQSINIHENFGVAGVKLVGEQSDDLQLHLSKRPKEPEVYNFLNIFFTRNTFNSYPSTSNYFTYTYPLPPHLTQLYDEQRARTETKSALQSAKPTRRANKKFRRRKKRRTRSVNVEFKGSSTGSEDAAENLNDSDDTITSLTTAVDSSSHQTTLARGLPVNYSSFTAADSSRSFDEDDIFALVAEDDLLSEESFDHLVKLTNDKIGDTNEEDYSSGTETVVESSSGSGTGATDNVHETPDQKDAIENFMHSHQPDRHEHHKHNEHSQPKDDDAVTDVDDEAIVKPNEDHDSEQNVVDTIYNSHLVGNINEGVVLLTEADSTHSLYPDTAEKERRQVTTTSSSEDSKAEIVNANRYHTILQSSFPLTRLNPWISACDLAQPGPLRAPDLQGECSAGTLPVSRVAEGPGPPTCLKSCKKETPFTNKLNKDNMINYLINNNSNNNNNNNINNNSKKNKDKNDNKLNKLVGYTTTTNTFNIKLRNSQPISDSVNTNNNNSNKNIDKDKNNKNNNNNNNIIQKLLKPFKNYQTNNNNNNKMAKNRRNSKDTSSAASGYSDVLIKSITMNITQRNEPKETQSQAVSLHSSEDYDLMLHNILKQQDKAASNKEIEHDDHQFNDAAITAVDMQLNQQQQQQQLNLNNNNVVKTKLTATNYNDNNSRQNKQFELKHYYVNQDHLSNNNNNSNKIYQSNNIINSQKRSDSSLPTTARTTVHLAVANNVNNDQYLNIPPPEKQEQQCLEYLGDSDKTMPTHLCHLLTPSERLAQLRQLRLRNCCERNVYSALHTLALNATLSGGAGCLRVLEDLMELDALASRATCALTEILFRFDCRQVYSIVHQCNDCKEAYRRWVCSTLVPYFAETSDIMKPPEILTTTAENTRMGSVSSSGDVNSFSTSYKYHTNSLNNNTTIMTSNMTTSHITATLPNTSNNNNNNGIDMSSVVSHKTITSNFITNSNVNQNDMQYDANNYQQHFYMQQKQQEEHHMKRRNIQQQQQKQLLNHKLINKSNSNSSNHNKINDFYYKKILIHHKNPPQKQQQKHPTTMALTFNGIITHNTPTTNKSNPLGDTLRQQNINETNEPSFGHNLHHKSTNKRQKRSDNSIKTTTIHSDVVVNRPSMSSMSTMPSTSSSASSSSSSALHQQQKQSFKFISTANNEDSFYDKNPVITNLLKRSKRKEFEFRKRRRIRPCLNVCQTVEQKCPYLLPADRAPSMPTQYAGEPTFLCLDYNVAETEEQLKRASHGPSECCYTYCSNSADGICTYCDDMWDKTEVDKEADVLSEKRELKVFNITMKTKGQEENAASIRVEAKIQKKIGQEKNGLKMSTVAIVVRNDTAFENATRLAERLQYYAFCDGVFYYDDDADDMPRYPNSESCRQLPSVRSRCSIPYYATNYISSADMLGSYRKNNEAQKLLIWLSTLLCLWSCYSVRSMRVRRYIEDNREQQAEHQHQHQQQQHKLTNTAFEGENMCQKCKTREIMQYDRSYNKYIIEISVCDYRESRVLIIYLFKTKNGTAKRIDHKKSPREKYLIAKHLRKNLRSSSIKMNLKILKIPTLIFLINYKEIFLLLLFKKRQKLRKRKIKDLLPTNTRVMELSERSWSILRYTSCKNLKSKPKRFSFNENKIHYYYYYCSCSQIFSCICNKNIKNNNKYIKKFKYNFSTCNFKNNAKGNKNRNNNKMMIMQIKYKTISIIKFNTTTTTTHTFIINSYNNKTICINVITIIIISYNVNNKSDKNNNNNQNKQILNSFSLNSNSSHHHYYYNDYYNDYNNYIYYYKLNFKPNEMINNNIVLIKTSRFTSTLTITITLYNLLKTNIISTITLMIIMMTLKMLIMLIMRLLFKPFMEIKYNNNHHMKNIIKFKLSFSPNTSYNSKEINYCYFYYYNFNINDWWQRRRWWRRRWRPAMHQIVENSNYYYSTESLFLSGLRSQVKFFNKNLL